MTSPSNDYEERIFDALDAYERGHLPSLSAAAPAYQIKPCTLQQYIKSASHTSKGRENMLMTFGQELVLCEWLERIVQLGFPPCLDLVCSRANLFLINSNITSLPSIGKNWPYNFLQQHKDFCLWKSIQLNVA